MGRPTSFRLPAELLERLEAEAGSKGSSVTALVAAILDEGLKMRAFPTIVYRDGPAGRRAGLTDGPDVWEVIRAIQETPGTGEDRLHQVAEETGLRLPQVQRALEFYLAFPAEIDQRIAEDARMAEELWQAEQRRRQLLSS